METLTVEISTVETPTEKKIGNTNIFIFLGGNKFGAYSIESFRFHRTVKTQAREARLSEPRAKTLAVGCSPPHVSNLGGVDWQPCANILQCLGWWKMLTRKWKPLGGKGGRLEECKQEPHGSDRRNYWARREIVCSSSAVINTTTIMQANIMYCEWNTSY